MMQFFSDVDRDFNLAECREELQAATQRLFDLEVARERQKATELMKARLPALVNRKLERREVTNFGLTELALPAGSAVDPMPAFRWVKLRRVLQCAATPDSLERAVRDANAKGLFLGARQLREAFIFLGSEPLRERLWVLTVRDIPEREDIEYALRVLPLEERRHLISLTRGQRGARAQ